MKNRLFKFHITSASGYSGISEWAIEHCRMVSFLNEFHPNLKYSEYISKANSLGICYTNEEIFSEGMSEGY